MALEDLIVDPVAVDLDSGIPGVNAKLATIIRQLNTYHAEIMTALSNDNDEVVSLLQDLIEDVH